MITNVEYLTAKTEPITENTGRPKDFLRATEEVVLSSRDHVVQIPGEHARKKVSRPDKCFAHSNIAAPLTSSFQKEKRSRSTTPKSNAPSRPGSGNDTTGQKPPKGITTVAIDISRQLETTLECVMEESSQVDDLSIYDEEERSEEDDGEDWRDNTKVTTDLKDDVVSISSSCLRITPKPGNYLLVQKNIVS